jgi:hypothetical protein
VENSDQSAQPAETPGLETEVSSERQRGMKAAVPGVVLCLLVSLAISAVTLFVYDRWYAQKIVAVDLKGYITL